MNKNLYRIVFNAARGIRMAVQETAMSAGKASGATSAAVGIALASLLSLSPASAQLVASPTAPGSLRPTILVAPNGVPLVGITTPSAAGVSRNIFSDFNVAPNGVILGNNRSSVQTQLGGWIVANPNLATGPARIVLVEVNSGNPSQLRGYIEVGGSRAEVIIANPAGISADGGGFINASRATLTTGTPQFGALGSLDSFLVRGGTVTINGAGLDASTTDYAAILARAVNVNAAIYATDLKVVTGANQISADHSQITPTAGTGPTPTFALDVSKLGGMYSGHIVLVGTEAGLGVRNAGSIGASAGNLVVTAAGRLENTGTLEGQSVQLASAADIDNRNGTIRQTSSAALTIAAPTLSNTAGGWIGTEPIAASTGSGTGTTGSTGTTSGSTGATSATSTTGAGTTSTGTSTGASAVAASTPPAPGAITAGGALLNDGGKIYAGGPITLQTANLVNNGGTLSVASMALNQPSFSNSGGTLNVSGALTANLGTFSNDAGTLHAGSLDITTSGDFSNQDGVLTSDADAHLTVGGAANNTRGTIAATGALTGTVTGALNNTSGTLASNQSLTLATQALNNSQGNISSANGNVQLTVGQQLLNTDGHIASGANVTLQTGSLDGTQGHLQSTGDLTVTAAQALTATGSNIAGGNATLQGASVDVSGSQTGAANIAIAATQGNVTTSGATVATPGTLAITANAQPSQVLANSAGTLNAGQLQINASNVANTNGGEIVQTGAGATTINVAGALNNNAGTIASAGAIAVHAGSMTNQGGKLQAAGTSSLSLSVANQLDNSAAGQILAGGNSTLSAGSLVNDGGTITAVGDLAATVTGAASNQGGTLAANGNTTVTAASFNNNGGTAAAVNGKLNVTTIGATTNNAGTLQAGGATTLSNGGLSNLGGKVFGNSLSVDTHGYALDNSGRGTLAATTTVAIRSGALANDTGLIQSGGAMTIDTNGQALANTNAAGYANGQGGLASADTLTLNAGAVNNNAGFIGSKRALVANTQGFSNTGGGLVVGQAEVSINSNGATYDNAGGQTQAVGALSVTAGGVQNTSGLIRAGGTTTVNAGTLINASTSGANQGIEGTNVALNVGNFNNQAGAVRADQSLTVTSGGTVDNSAGGLLSAGDTLKVIDPNAANPAAKTLNLVNTNGTLVANNSVQIDAATFSGDGTLVSGKDLSLALTQDLVNNAEVIANGNLSYGTAGNLTNNGKLIAGNTLTVSGNVVTNTANAEMSGANATVNAGTLTNRGLIDSRGLTRINAGAVNNVGSGRIYGNHVAIATGTLTNDVETVGGVTQAGTIAARQRLDIAASTISNREHALIFSGGGMGIGGALDANSVAVGSGGTLNNLSARIESLGDMSVAMGQINNLDTHIQLGPQTTTSKVVTTIAPVGGSGMYTTDEVVVIPGQPFVWARNPDGSTGALLYSNGYGIWNTTFTTTADTAVNADPAAIVSGGDMTLNGAVLNRDSKIVAGGTLMANNVTNTALQGQYRTTSLAVVVNDKGQIQPLVVGPTQAGTTNVGAFEYVDHVNGTSGAGIGAAAGGTASASGGGAGTANGGAHTGTIVEVAANVGMIATTGGAGTGGLSGTSTQSSQTVPTVVRTSTPTLTLPQASLYRTNAGNSHYLIETDPRFANYRKWLSSDYLLNNLGLDPNNTLKRLGDGFYEQQLINQQIAQLTGYRYVDGYDNDQDQYTALMNNGATFARQYGLTVGIALTAAQMAQLTSDIVWLVEQTVTLPDGSTQRVLVPQVYVRVRPGDIDGSGALLSADATVIKSSGDLVNTGTIAGRSLVSINADNVNNLSGGRIAGGSIGINAKNDINNIGASITAADAAVLTAGRDINIRTTTGSGSVGNNNIDRIAGVYVSNPGGVLIASAGRDVNLIAGIMSSAGSASVGAGRNITLGTVTESGTGSAFGQGIAGTVNWSREVGSVIQANDNVRLAAGNDLNIRASAVQSSNGALVATAKNDINITAGQATSNVATASVHSSGSLMRRSSTSTFDSTSTTDVLSSSLSGKTVALVAGNDINAQAAQLSSQDAMSLSAGRDINFTTATSSSTDLHASQTRTSSTGLSRAWALASDAGGPVGGYGNRQSSGNSTSADIRTQAVGTTVSAGSLQTVSGRDTTLQAATVVADGDITMLAGRNLTIESAQNTEISTSSSANSKSGFIGSWSSPGLGHIKDFGAQTASRTTQQSSQVASLTGDVTLVAGNEYRQTASSVLAAGQAGPLVGGDVNILARNVTINEAYDTEQTVGVSRSSSTKLGGSASFMGVSTDNIRNAQSTVRAMGDTSGNTRMQALGVMNLAMAGKQAYGAASTLSGALNGSGPSLTSMSEMGTLSYGVSVSLSRNTAQGANFSNSSTAVGSSVVGSNNVNIVATGGGAASNIHAVGSTIAAGNTVNLAADNDITLEASRDTAVSAGRNSSHGASVGVTFGAGAQNGFSIQLGVQNGQGRDNQNDITYNATQVSGGNAVNISSSRNLTLNGATVEANRVTADVGGDLNITTLQDVSVGQSRQSSNGFGVSLCIPPICYGAVATVSASAAGAKADGVFVSPNTQSGIKAGDGGFNVNVAGNTNLTGAVIESTQAAIDAGRDRFATGGTLTMSDLQNVSQSGGSSYSVSASASAGQTTNPNATPQQQQTQNQLSQPGIKPGGAGVGSYSGNNQSSTTRSGISGIAGDQSVRTGNNASAGTLVRDWNTQTILQNVQAQAQLTQQFNQNVSREIGTYAANQAAQLRDQARTEADPDKQQALLNEASMWDEGGVYRVALHTAAGALGGGAAGAAGAAASSASVPYIAATVNATGLPDGARELLIATASTALGASVGGGLPGAAAAFNEVINNCLASSCLSIQWDKDAPGYHAYGPIRSPTLCNVAEAGCMDAVQQQLSCNSAPGQPGCTSTGETRRDISLSLGNQISQYLSPNGQVVINGTNEGQHMLDNGYVMRWISTDSQGGVRIMTYGEGVNMSWYGIPGAVMGGVNTVLGPGIFTNLGVQNQIGVRDSLLNRPR
ncbi:hemagglutinin repeat-containing protein [Variovorax sp. RT4R15]|uniref:hemagglutinin repeat-containing protein n=1 Tax=Variovorax sp. RT4R15 TaxID=3443737 RepID=UPI003F465215